MPISLALVFLREQNEKDEEQLTQIYATWELLGKLHGVDLKIPFLQEKRQEERRRQKAKRPPLPLHLQFMKAGVKVKVKK